MTAASADPPAQRSWRARFAGPRSIRSSLRALVLACVLPMLLRSAGLAYLGYRLERERTHRDTFLVAQNLTADVDREWAGIESALRTLATSSDLAAGDLASFHRRATEALKFHIGNNFVMTAREGRQLFNTLVPDGTALPVGGPQVRTQRVFETGQPFVSGLVAGAVNRAPIAAMGVPVMRGSEIAYSLNRGVSPEQIGAALRRKALPEGWIAALLDGTGTIVARSRDAERFVGQQATLAAAANRAMAWVALGAALALGLGLWRASRLAGRVTAAMQGLFGPSLALGSGLPLHLPPRALKEAQAVGAALLQAEQALARAKHLAHHDALAGLCNRLLFNEVALHQLATTQRKSAPLALLAIDVDGFKAVNDQLGHAARDAVLKTAAARIAGDEFAVLLGDTNLAGAQVIAHKLLAVLAAPYADLASPLSASIGIADFPESGVIVPALFDSADGALYQAKRAGKGRAASQA